MFGFLKKNKKNKQLEEIIQRLKMNAANNYKDAAQLNLKEFESAFTALQKAGKLSEGQQSYYQEKLSEFRKQMKNFSHKDQKPTWV